MMFTLAQMGFDMSILNYGMNVITQIIAYGNTVLSHRRKGKKMPAVEYEVIREGEDTPASDWG